MKGGRFLKFSSDFPVEANIIDDISDVDGEPLVFYSGSSATEGVSVNPEPGIRVEDAESIELGDEISERVCSVCHKIFFAKVSVKTVRCPYCSMKKVFVAEDAEVSEDVADKVSPDVFLADDQMTEKDHDASTAVAAAAMAASGVQVTQSNSELVAAAKEVDKSVDSAAQASEVSKTEDSKDVDSDDKKELNVVFVEGTNSEKPESEGIKSEDNKKSESGCGKGRRSGLRRKLVKPVDAGAWANENKEQASLEQGSDEYEEYVKDLVKNIPSKNPDDEFHKELSTHNAQLVTKDYDRADTNPESTPEAEAVPVSKLNTVVSAIKRSIHWGAMGSVFDVTRRTESLADDEAARSISTNNSAVYNMGVSLENYDDALIAQVEKVLD